MVRQPDRKPRLRDTVFTSGWLFADLLLALAVLFLAANTIGIKIPPPPPPKLVVTPVRLEPTNSNCTVRFSRRQCTVALTETADSLGNVNWTASSDISTGLVFSPESGFLSPGKSVNLQISHIPCENDSFTFSGSRGEIPTNPVRVLWQCQGRLESSSRQIILQNVDYNGLLNGSSQAIGNFKHGIEGQSILKGNSVGLAIVYGGAPTVNDIGQAYNIGGKVESILKGLVNDGFVAFQRASYYGPLYSLGTSLSFIEIDVYLFIQ